MGPSSATHPHRPFRWNRPLSKLPPRPRSWLDAIGDFIIAWGGIGYVVFIVTAITYFARFIACPAVYDDGYCSDQNLLAAFLVLQILGNLALFSYFQRENRVEHWQRHSVVASLCKTIYGDEESGPRVVVEGGRGGGEEAEDEEEEEEDDGERERNRGKFCVECNRYSPIRSHHCPLCKYCVLRKDHHCFITGACVGLGTQRYFIVFCFWAMVGCAVGASFIFVYMDKEIEHWYPFGWLHYIAPVAVGRWLFSYSPMWEVWACIVFSFALASCIGAMSFFIMQIFYTLHGYTMFEYHSLSIREAYDGDGKTAGERMRLVFGPYWLLHFIIPTFWLKQKLTPEIADNLFRVRSKLL